LLVVLRCHHVGMVIVNLCLIPFLADKAAR
jgi:hypothetical protein